MLIGKRRDRMDVICDILRVADNQLGSKKTRLVYHSNINFTRFEAFLAYLLEKGFMEMKEDDAYRTTARGRTFLRETEKLDNLIEG